MEIKYQKDLPNKEKITFSIQEQELNGICGGLKKELEEMISLRFIEDIIVKKNEKKLNEALKKDLKKQICIVKEEWEDSSYLRTVNERIQEEIKRKNLTFTNTTKKIKDSLKIVGLKLSILERDSITLSSSEKKLLQISISLLSNPEILILEEPFKYLDLKKQKNIIFLLRKIKEQFNKTVIIVGEDSEILYKYTNHIIITSKQNIILEGQTKKIYQNVEVLRKNKIDIPKIVEFTHLAKTQKKVKIDYHTDIRDIIKDIYKHV